MGNTEVLRRARRETSMEMRPAARAGDTSKTHEPMIDDIEGIDKTTLVEPAITAPVAPDIARVRAILRAAKVKTFGASPRG